MSSTNPPKSRRIAVLGARAVGKSSLVIQFCENHFVESYYPTIESTFTKTIRYKGYEYSVEIMDTAGQDEYSILSSHHASSMDGYVLVYSISSRSSFDMVKIIRDKILDFTGLESVPCVVVGNKSDLSIQRQISPEEGKELGEQWQCSTIETSAKHDENVYCCWFLFTDSEEQTQVLKLDFPNRIQTILTNTVKADVNAIVYPSYKTAGDLRLAVENFSVWLGQQVADTKKDMDRLNSSGKIMIVLLGHSMGGIVSAETILRFNDEKSACLDQLQGASIIGMLAFDTPFYSINQNFVADKAWSSVDQVRGLGNLWNTGTATIAAATATRAINASNHGSTSGRSGGGSAKKWGLFAGVVGAAAIGAAAYVARDKIQATLADAYDQLTFISDLTDIHSCDQRVKKLLKIPDIFFKCFYVQLNELGSDHRPKTFIKLPPEEVAYLFVPVPSSAENEIAAHTSMFNPKKTDHYYELGSDSISLISEMVSRFQRKNGPPLILAKEEIQQQQP
ncbi:hypothetical protein [Parasitella parasitica]|uniref:Uncharacterized protein n=1 Tax=Parasitella parasitica TaxID=35722 RepID=A0A0B7N9F3_9FUNG|nr:hypothetical protein [Parasitella parasitica]